MMHSHGVNVVSLENYDRVLILVVMDDALALLVIYFQ